ncbi:MAG: DUF4389 domain-containing protein [Gammaproteobacteria bacterium]|nr:DUF4389 domain-containing protein [Gammaproteobacteria bacterium]MDJ0889808.1 DUF4389 domain-containing protein [Gammaproteobacteria bacterium]
MNTRHLEQSVGPVAVANNLSNRDIAARFLRVVILAACYFILELVAKALTVAQFMFVVWKRRPNRGMARLGLMIAAYMNSLWRYCTFASDDAPWPFQPWPRGDRELRG